MSNVALFCGGLLDGERVGVRWPGRTVQVPLYEGSVLFWDEDHYVRSFPCEVYRLRVPRIADADDELVYTYSHTIPVRFSSMYGD